MERKYERLDEMARIRRAQGISQRELSKKLDMDVAYIGMVEIGVRRLNPSLALTISGILGCLPHELYGSYNTKHLKECEKRFIFGWIKEGKNE